MGIFGWSLPPGCNTLPGEEDMGPCEDCNLCDENGSCPASSIKNGITNVDYDICPKMAETKCHACGKVYDKPKLLGEFKREEVVSGIWDNIFCCSEGCARTEKEKVDKLAQELAGPVIE